MPIGLDFSPHCLVLTRGNGTVQTVIHHGVVGVTSRWHEPIVWTDPYATRATSGQTYLSLSQLWQDFIGDYKAQTALQTMVEKEAADIPTIELIVEALQANIPEYSAEFSVLAIDNTISEFHQTAILKQMGNAGFGRRELLWRPIALALSHLTLPHNYEEGDSLLIVDTDAYQPELTWLELKEHRGQIVPLRKLPKKRWEAQENEWTGYSSANVLRHFIEDLSGGDQGLFTQLMTGPFSGDFLNYLDSGNKADVWIRKDLNHSKFHLNSKMSENLGRTTIAGNGFDDLRSEVQQMINDLDPTLVLWHGLPVRLNSKSLGTDHHVVDADAISVGAAEYGRRRLADEPTYLDTLPGLEILSLEKKTGSHKFFTVIPAGEVEGGETVRIPETITKFSLEDGIKKFTAVLHNIAEDKYKESITDLPPIEYDGNIPLLLSAEMRPAQGHAIVTIEGRDGYVEIFGSQRKIELEWDTMIDIPNPIEQVAVYTGPVFYPVRGRIADDSDSLSIAREFATGRFHVGAQFDYPCGRVGYLRIHEPWGYKNPCGHIIKKEQRALFGALKEKDPEIQKLAKAIGEIVNDTVKNPGDRHRYLNYMFRYAPEKFREELRNLYKLKQPTLNVNSVYAVGRTFYRKEDFEIFLDFFITISKKIGYPEYPSDRYTPAYFWSFFRALCYYKQTSLVDRVKVEGVLDCICNYAAHCSKNGWPDGKRSNVIKYLLFGILFSLRLREHNHDFLSIDSRLCKGIVKVIKKQTPQIPYPRTIMKYQLPGTLNDYVLRFVKDIQTKKDLKALHGLVVE